jgi:hypothetical protein
MKRLLTLTFALFSFAFFGCESYESDYDYSGSSSNYVSKPTFDKYLTTTDTDGFSIRLRFSNGGEERSNMSCTVYWKAYSSKPSSTPSKGDLTKCEQMRIYDHTKTKTTFDKSHAGYSGGTYIYYYAVCSNSKGSCTTSINYTIVKR